MVVYELRQSAHNKALDLIEEAKHNNKKTKIALCELYDCLMSCREGNDEYSEYDEDEEYDQNYAEIGAVEIGSINYRDEEEYPKHDEYMHMHRGMRGGMRRGMREHMYDMPKYSHKNLMHARRNRAGRYSY